MRLVYDVLGLLIGWAIASTLSMDDMSPMLRAAISGLVIGFCAVTMDSNYKTSFTLQER